MVVGIAGTSPFSFISFIDNLSRGHRPEHVMLGGLTWPDERVVDECGDIQVFDGQTFLSPQRFIQFRV
jgi:hypothetical protein